MSIHTYAQTTIYSEGFEGGFPPTGWTLTSPTFNMNWERENNYTASSNTGPSGPNSGTYYMFTESSGSTNFSKQADATSQSISLAGYTSPTLSFYYHMYGNNIGTLDVQISTNGITWNTEYTLSGETQSDETDPWLQTPAIDLSAYTGNTIYVRFHSTSGDGSTGGDYYRSDMAVDDVVISGLSSAPEINIQGAGNNIAHDATLTNTPSTTNDTDFGNVDVTVGTNTNTFTIQNTGTANLNLTGAPLVVIGGANPGDFTVNTTLTTSPVAVSGSTTFSITFNPSASGIRSATVSIDNNDGDENPYTFNVRGTGTTTLQEIDITGNGNSVPHDATLTNTPSVTNSTDFGNVNITGSSNANTFTIYNLGTTGSLNLTGVPLVDIGGANAADFTVTTLPTTPIAASSTTTFVITFNPTTLGVKNATVTIYNNDPTDSENPYTFNIRGTGTDIKAPGGIDTDLQLWLKGNAGLSYTDGQAVSLWSDQGNASDAFVNTAGQEPTYKDNPTDNVNFNPVVHFDNLSTVSSSSYNYSLLPQEYMEAPSGFYSNDIFIVVIPDVTVNSSFGSMDIFCGDSNIGSVQNDGTGIGFGAYSQRFSNEVLCYARSTSSGLNSGFGVAETGAATYDNAGIINTRHNVANNGQELYYNGINKVNTTSDGGTWAAVTNTKFWLGRSEGWRASFDGRVAEVITYSSRKNDTDLTQERNRIQSYLAIKYGITLGVNGTSQDYVDSDGNVIWDQDVNAGYNYDIAGIGRDDKSELNQKQSSSINNATDGTGPTEGILTIGLSDIYNTNNINIASNPTTFTDRQFLTWGNNGADLDLAASVINVDMSAGIGTLSTPVTFTGMQRIWKVVENGGDIPSVSVRIPQNAIRNISPPGSYLMFISDSDIFDPTADYRVMTPDGSGNLETDYDFNGTKYITFGYAPQIIVERSIYFDGVVDYADVEDNLDLNTTAFTISAWIKRDTGTTNASIVSKRDAANTEGYDFRINGSGALEFNLNGGAPELTSTVSIPENEWHQVAIIYSNGNATLYIDGVPDTSASSLPAPTATSRKFLIAAADGYDPNTTDYFAGNIDEIRVWDTALTPDQLRYVMNQEISNDATLALEYGDVIPTTITKNDISAVPWANLAGYYPMSVYTYTNTNDLSGNNHQAALRNLDTVDHQTAPLPYESQNDGDWAADATWLNNSVQTLPNSLSIVDGTPIEWNIVKTNHNVNIRTNANLGRERAVLGLFVESNELQVNGNTAAGTGNGLTVTHYLKLDGKIDLEGESQLIQTEDSELDVTSSGTLERDQQGTADLFTYNYWAAPVGVTSIVSNNTNYTLQDVLSDGTNPAAPGGITWSATGYNGAPGPPITIADYWVWKFTSQLNNNNEYAAWQHVRSTGSLQPGEGYTMKGTTNTGGAITTEQNYVFNGKPHNANVTLSLLSNSDYLIGNPYASAIDANEFILDNISDNGGRAGSNIINGSLYFWEHFASSTHVLKEYQGGYGAYSLLAGGTGTVAVSNDARINNTGSLVSTKGAPERFIPVAQGFFVTAEDGGTITFKNSQRIFKTEASDPSIFMRANDGMDKQKKASVATSKASKTINGATYGGVIKLYFDSPKGYHRQIAVGADSNTTDGFDIGFDALMIDGGVEDMYWAFANDEFVIQGVSDFNTNRTLPLGIKIDQDGNATIRIDELKNVPIDTNIYVHDKDMDVYHNLRESNYETFLIAGEYLDRFEITFSNGEEDIPDPTEGYTKANVHFSNTKKSIVVINPNDLAIDSIEMINILGQSVFKDDVTFNDRYKEIKVSHLNTGAYIINMITNKGVVTKKVVVE